MLSNPSPLSNSALYSRQRLHRRQKSSPTALEAMRAPNYLPSDSASPTATATAAANAAMSSPQRPQPARPLGHRRGLSLDTRRQQLQQRHVQQQQQKQLQQQRIMEAAAVAEVAGGSGSTNATVNAQQEFSSVSITSTNPGLSTTTQHAMRETQHQRPVGRGTSNQAASFAEEEALLYSPQHQQAQFYSEPTSAMMRKTLSGGGAPMSQQDFQQLYSNSPDDQGLATATFMNYAASNNGQDAAIGPVSGAQGWGSEDETSSTRRAPRRVSNGILDRVAKFETMGMDGGLARPTTPPHQNDIKYLPPTPRETPQERMTGRFADGYDESMEETLKPQRLSKSRPARLSGVFEDMRRQAEAAETGGVMASDEAAVVASASDAALVATPPRPSLAQMPMTPADFMNMSSISAEFFKMPTSAFGPMAVPPADMQHLSPPMSQHPTPATAQGMFDASGLWPMDYDTPTSMATSFLATGSSPVHPSVEASIQLLQHQEQREHRRAAHRRNESMASVTSMASMASAASIASINVEELRTETGVTLDDIATYIDGPSVDDGKWRCLYDGCGKRFGRKENIKSHVQTHLNDRQYQCPHCQKCFVRQHDLKRHAKIHTGIKPYPCECGNNFARHDALTRHRQRGMCIGAFDGAVRKVGKRGRPRKARPNLEERRDKATRTARGVKRAAAGNGLSSRADGRSSSPEASQSGYSDSSEANSPQTENSDNALDDPFGGSGHGGPNGQGGQGGQDGEEDGDEHDDLLDFGDESDQGNGSGNVHQGSGNTHQANGSSTHQANGSSTHQANSYSAYAGSKNTTSHTMNPSALSMCSAPMPGAQNDNRAAKSPSASFSSMSHSPSHSSLGDHDLPVDPDLPEHTSHYSQSVHASQPPSPAKSAASHYTQHPNTPPELSASSSPPQTSSTAHYFDCTEEDVSLGGMSAPLMGSGMGGLGMGSMGSMNGLNGMNGMGSMSGLSGMSLSMGMDSLSCSLEDDILMMKPFASGPDDVLVQMDNSGLSMLNTSKFDDEYGMFGSDDVFFA